MALSDKIRKTLWARSGNKCCVCKTILVRLRSESDNSVIVGEECHIISRKEGGPRFEVLEQFDYDSEDNLLLLCANCHKIIDENVQYYTKERLVKTKTDHEEFIRLSIESKDPNNLFPKFDGIILLPKITSGKEIYHIISDVMAMEYDFEDTSDADENDFISSTFQDLMDYSDYLGMEVEVGAKLSIIKYLNEMLATIEQRRFMLFGEKRKRNHRFKDGGTDEWSIAAFYLMKYTNPNILNLAELSK